MEVAAEALLVGQPGDPDDHAVGVLPVGEEPQRGGLAAELVLGVVQVGEVLDLGHRHEPGEAGAERRAEDGLLVEQGVEDPGRPEAVAQAARDAVDPALDRHVLAEDEHVVVVRELVGQGLVDGLREGQRPRVGRTTAVAGGPRSWGSASGAITSAAAREPRLRADLDRQGRGPAAGPPRSAPARPPRSSWPLSTSARAVPSSGSRGVVGLDRRRRAVGDLDVRAGVAHEPHRAQVEHGGGAPGAHGGQRLLGRLQQGDRVVAVRVEVRDAREVLQHGRRPAPRRTRADAEAVVLADEQQRAVAVHVGEVRRRVERAGRRRVVDRGVAEAGDDHRVLRPRRLPGPAAFASPRAKPSPTARGRCEAIVDVCGMTCSPAWPNTLCRPPEIGSDAEPVRLRSVSRTGSTLPSTCARAA